MGWPRLVQLLGLLVVTGVLVGSLVFVDDMTFEFGGLGLGAALFLLGKWMERPDAA